MSRICESSDWERSCFFWGAKSSWEKWRVVCWVEIGDCDVRGSEFDWRESCREVV